MDTRNEHSPLQMTTLSIDDLNREVAERKKVEERLRRSDERFRQVAENAEVFIWEVDADGLYTYANPQVETILGYTPEEVVRKKHFYDFFAADVRERLKKAAFEAFARREAFRNFVNANVHKNGALVILETSGVPIVDDQDNLIGYRGADLDITERMRAVQTLKAAAAQWDATFNSIADPVSVQDVNHRLLRVNKTYADVFDKSPEQLIGKPCYEIVHGTDTPRPDCPCRIVSETKKPAVSEIFDPCSGVYLEVCVSPLFDSDGEIEGYVHIARNITERKQAEQRQAELHARLAAMNRDLEDFAYVVSHDLKTPLRAIRTLSEWLLADYQDKFDPEGRENLQLLGNRVDRMENLIEGILQYSRIGRIEPGVGPVDLNQLIPQIIDTLDVPKHISIQIAPDLPVIEANVTRIREIFQNLLSNAIKYMDKPQGNIAVGCEQDGDFWRFSVSDNGPGIEKNHRDRIFKLFQTLAPRDRCGGAGLGLAIVKRIVQTYGGEVGVESEAGVGSTFFFTFPRHQMEATDAGVRTHTVCTV